MKLKLQINSANYTFNLPKLPNENWYYKFLFIIGKFITLTQAAIFLYFFSNLFARDTIDTIIYVFILILFEIIKRLILKTKPLIEAYPFDIEILILTSISVLISLFGNKAQITFLPLSILNFVIIPFFVYFAISLFKKFASKLLFYFIIFINLAVWIFQANHTFDLTVNPQESYIAFILLSFIFYILYRKRNIFDAKNIKFLISLIATFLVIIVGASTNWNTFLFNLFWILVSFTLFSLDEGKKQKESILILRKSIPFEITRLVFIGGIFYVGLQFIINLQSTFF